MKLRSLARIALYALWLVPLAFWSAPGTTDASIWYRWMAEADKRGILGVE